LVTILAVLALANPVYSNVLCYVCAGISSANGTTCSNDHVSACETACTFHVASNGTWSTGCGTATAPSTTQSCSFDPTSKNTKCSCTVDFCNDFDQTVDDLLLVWIKASVNIPMVFPSEMATECFQCGQLNITGRGIIVIPCDAAHTCHGDYCVSKRGDRPHSYCGTAWDGEATVSCMKMPNQPEICICEESFCNPVLDPVEEPSSTTTTTTASTTSAAAAATTTSAAAPPTTTPAATTVPVGGTTTHPKCKNGSFTPNSQAVSMGEKLKNIISNAFNAVNIDWFQSGIDDHICNYSSPS
ncbi:hypothetical protein PFISCL1PPCAC_15980, partial [Pristionchus fissidentatus]